MSTTDREVFWNAVDLRTAAAERVAARADLATWERLCPVKGRRFPYRLRADGQRKGLHLERVGRAALGAWVAFYVLDRPIPPELRSAERTRSARARAGSRRTRRLVRGAR